MYPRENLYLTDSEYIRDLYGNRWSLRSTILDGKIEVKNPFPRSVVKLISEADDQSDQIWQFIGLWATF